MTPIIQVEGLGKKYRLHHQPRERYTTLRDTLARKVKGLLRRSHSASSTGSDEDFWALKDVNFEVGQGEVVGIIGRNGAGKSTLLKILSRITEPSVGRITLRGRVASLLEVGTGFHPELTGRENIFLNGAILGMTRAEIRAKFDEIVAFAEVERFLDTPVKHYSSGMYVRLAFAVAAHLEPEILIVDEVLAVGDAQFQKKCLGRMRQVAQGDGRTVLFVSHQLATVQEICSRGIVLASGSIQKIGPIADVIGNYLEATATSAGILRSKYVTEALVTDICDQSTSSIRFDETLVVNVSVKNNDKAELGLNLAIRNEAGRLICLFSTNPHDGVRLPQKDFQLKLCLPNCRLAPGSYNIDLAITDPGISILEDLPAAVSFAVTGKALGGTWPYDARFGDYFPLHDWEVK